MSTNYTELPAKPRPIYTAANEPYWAALRAHRLVIQRCQTCATFRHYPRPMCERCYSMDYTWDEVEPSGTIYSWSTSHHPFHPGFKQDLPYVTLTVELKPAVRLQAPLVDDTEVALALGMPVDLEFIDVDEELTLPYFRLASA